MKTLLLSVIVLSVIAFGSASAEKVDFSQCAKNPDHHCYSYAPQLNQVPPSATTSWDFDIFLPDGTCNVHGAIKSNGDCSYASRIVSDDNWTNTKNNVGIESLQNIHTVASNPNQNYCPLGLYTLLHQDGYLYKIYNNATGLDLTGYMYPAWCHRESGANPINGDNSQVIPEFPTAPVILVTIISLVVVLGRMVDGHWVWKL